MNAFGSQVIYKQLLRRHGRIRIPMIQRDYAQGRALESEVREEFLGALESALKLPADDPSLPLNLDFIYGSVEGHQETRFYPLDGQQRLTTLFFLHWYLAWNDECWPDFRALFRINEHSRFSYSVRPDSNDFFDALVAFEPECRPSDVALLSGLFKNQPWYFRRWRLDPTIQSALNMLDAIHNRFAGTNGLFGRLVSEDRPAITFQLLDLKNFGLSDDLYIKMNARGKPLTPFETFKARYEQELAKQFSDEVRRIGDQEFCIADFVSRRLDTTWADLFWAHRDKNTNLIDEAILNVFRIVALVTRNPESSEYLSDVALLRDEGRPPSYSTFHTKGWLDRDFTETLISLLENWCSENEGLKHLLPDSRYFDEEEVFERLIQSPTNLTLPEVVEFSGYALFIRQHEQSFDSAAFQDWMRLVHNLAVNSNIERADELRSSARGLRELLPNSSQVLNYFSRLVAANKITGFNDQQVREEAIKAGLILCHDGWRPLIDRAESHGYFRGQIEFLLHFCGMAEKCKTIAIVDWDDDVHVSLQDQFQEYLKKAEVMFNKQGLMNVGEFGWQRAMLSIGDYLLPSGNQNQSFLVSASTEPASWKRLLRGNTTKASEARQLLQRLWDRLTNGRPVGEQLNEIISGAKDLEPWREAFVRTPEALRYCGRQVIRKNSESEVFLLSKSQMNGAHAELFTFCLHDGLLRKLDRDGRLRPLKLEEYEPVISADVLPHIRLSFQRAKDRIVFTVAFQAGRFVICANYFSLENLTDIETLLCESIGFTKNEGRTSKASRPTEIENSLLELAKTLATVV